MATNQDWCDKHREAGNEAKRAKLKSKIELLPKYEGGNWYRHKCPFCAYEEGFGLLFLFSCSLVNAAAG